MSSGEHSSGREEEREPSAAEERSFHDVLDVKPGATREEIEAAYRRALRLIEGNSLGGYLMLEPDAREGAKREVERAFEALMQREEQAFEALMQREEQARPQGASEQGARTRGGEGERGARRSRRRRKRKAARKGRAERAASESSARETEGDVTLPVRPALESAEAEATVSHAETAPISEEEPRERPTTPPRKKKPRLRFLAPVIETAGPLDPEPPREAPRTTSVSQRPTASEARPLERQASQPPTRRPWLYSDIGAETVTEPRVIPRSAEEDDEHLTLPPESEINGGAIRRLREARGITLEELAEQTHIRKSYLIAIEEQNLEELPAGVYLRGFLTQIARVLRVDKKRLAEGYMSFVSRFRR